MVTDADAKLAPVAAKSGGGVEALIAMHAKANNIPEDLVHRVVQRESRYNPRASAAAAPWG
jgi:soluble lytic murein transglycosylase-like protein